MIEKTLHGGRARLIYGRPNLESLRELPDDSVHCVVTSPPYFGLRDYGADGQVGLEETAEEFVQILVEIFREVRRVLHPSGTVWLNLGDSYSGGGGYSPDSPCNERRAEGDDWGKMHRFKAKEGKARKKPRPGYIPPGLKYKDLMGIPWRVALALQADGWWLRQDIIWHKPNPMPESCVDRCTKAHEYLFLLTKRPRYFYDHLAIAEEAVGGASSNTDRKKRPTSNGRGNLAGSVPWDGASTRNRRSVWTIQTRAFKGAHFATFPEEIPRICIAAGSSAGGVCSACGAPAEPIREKIGERVDRWGESNAYEGYRDRKATAIYETTGWARSCECKNAELNEAVVLDPFSGSGTTGKVALALGRSYIGLDVNQDYLEMALRRVDQYTPDEISEPEEERQISLFTGVDK